MINWDLVLIHLESHLKVVYPEFYSEHLPLKDILAILYYLDMSTTDISNTTRGEVSNGSVIKKMKELGLTLRGRGGRNYMKAIPMTRKEYETTTNVDLARKYKVGVRTIRNAAVRMGWPLKMAGHRSKVVLL